MALFEMLFKKFQFSGTNWVSKKLTNGKNHNQTLVLWLQNTLAVITLELLILLVILVKYIKATQKLSKHVGVKLSCDQRKAKWLLESVLSMNGSHTIVINVCTNKYPEIL